MNIKNISNDELESIKQQLIMVVQRIHQIQGNDADAYETSQIEKKSADDPEIEKIKDQLKGWGGAIVAVAIAFLIGAPLLVGILMAFIGVLVFFFGEDIYKKHKQQKFKMGANHPPMVKK